MAAVDAAMTLRLETAAVTVEVNTALIPVEPVDLADVVRVPITAPKTPVELYPTPVAALLQRTHQRLTDGGWCTGALKDEQGARCLLGAIRKEAGGNQRLEADGLDVLMDAIRRKFPGAQSVPSFNDHWTDARMPLRLLQQAADLADARGL
jgi:hypothetical protein